MGSPLWDQLESVNIALVSTSAHPSPPLRVTLSPAFSLIGRPLNRHGLGLLCESSFPRPHLCGDGRLTLESTGYRECEEFRARFPKSVYTRPPTQDPQLRPPHTGPHTLFCSQPVGRVSLAGLGPAAAQTTHGGSRPHMGPWAVFSCSPYP